jgi:hypothetical protein
MSKKAYGLRNKKNSKLIHESKEEEEKKIKEIKRIRLLHLQDQKEKEKEKERKKKELQSIIDNVKEFSCLTVDDLEDLEENKKDFSPVEYTDDPIRHQARTLYYLIRLHNNSYECAYTKCSWKNTIKNTILKYPKIILGIKNNTYILDIVEDICSTMKKYDEKNILLLDVLCNYKDCIYDKHVFCQILWRYSTKEIIDKRFFSVVFDWGRISPEIVLSELKMIGKYVSIEHANKMNDKYNNIYCAKYFYETWYGLTLDVREKKKGYSVLRTLGEIYHSPLFLVFSQSSMYRTMINGNFLDILDHDGFDDRVIADTQDKLNSVVEYFCNVKKILCEEYYMINDLTDIVISYLTDHMEKMEYYVPEENEDKDESDE